MVKQTLYIAALLVCSLHYAGAQEVSQEPKEPAEEVIELEFGQESEAEPTKPPIEQKEIEAIKANPTQENLDRLGKLMKHDSITVVRAALDAAVELQKKRLHRYVIDLLSDNSQTVHWTQAMDTLVAMKAVSALPLLEVRAAAQDANIRLKAIESIIALQGEQSLRFIVRGLRDTDRRIRLFCIENIGGIKWQELAVRLLEQYIREPEREIRAEILTKLREGLTPPNGFDNAEDFIAQFLNQSRLTSKEVVVALNKIFPNEGVK